MPTAGRRSRVRAWTLRPRPTSSQLGSSSLRPGSTTAQSGSWPPPRFTRRWPSRPRYGTSSTRWRPGATVVARPALDAPRPRGAAPRRLRSRPGRWATSPPRSVAWRRARLHEYCLLALRRAGATPEGVRPPTRPRKEAWAAGVGLPPHAALAQRGGRGGRATVFTLRPAADLRQSPSASVTEGSTDSSSWAVPCRRIRA